MESKEAIIEIGARNEKKKVKEMEHFLYTSKANINVADEKENFSQQRKLYEVKRLTL